MLIATDKLRDEFKQARANLRRAISEKPERPSVLRMPRSISVHGDRTPSRGIRQAADLMNLAPPIRDPRLNPDNIYIPYSDSASGIVNPVLNEWYTYYYKHHPLVGNAIELHSQLPISRFGLTGVDDPQIMQVYEQMVDDLDLITNAYNYLKCWWLFGEVMPYCWWSEGYNRFVQMTFIETSRVRVMGHYLCFSEIGDLTQRYELEPDKMLQDLVRANDPFSRELVDYLDPEIVMSVRRGMNLELDPFSTELMANKALAWDLRGTSILQGVLKDLVHYDTLRNAQRAVADGHIAPKWIWKLGQPGPDGYMPTDGDLQAFRELLMAANQDPNFNIITHYAVSVEVIGSAGKILPIAQELDGVDSRILTRLFTNKALTHGEGPSYANASVALRALMSRYIPVRDSFEQYMDHKIFMPVALANNFIDKDGYPITPGINWRHKQALLDDASIRSMLLQMRERGDMPLKVLADGLDLDYDELLKWLDAEQGTIADRAMVKAKDTLLTKMLQQAEKGLAGIAEAFRQLRLPKNKEEGELLDKGKDVPEGYDPDENKQLSTDTEKKPPAVTPTPAPAPKSPTEKPQAPLGGESGEKVVQSYRRQRNHRRATKPVDFHPMRAQGYPISFVDGFSLNEWQERLRLTTIDKNSQQEIVAAEVNILNSFTNATDEFVSILLNVWRQKGSIGLQEVEHAVRDVIEGVNNESANGLRNSLTNLFNGAQEAAVDKLRRSKRGRRYLKKRGQTEDERRRNMNDALDQAFGKITTVSSEVIDRMRSILRDQPGGISQDIVQSLFAEFNAAELAGLSEAEIGERLGELWNRMRYVYERIIRTETVNMYNRAGLQEWADAGYTQVIRREINDNRTCAYCRTVDGLTFDINKLLKLDYPLIQDAETGEYVGHPNCFVSPKILVDTLRGQIPLGKIDIGDLVLTHRGRYKKVINVLRRRVPVGTGYFEITFETFGKFKQKFATICVTEEHPILTRRGWISAADIIDGDIVMVRAEYCVDCGDAVPFNNQIRKLLRMKKRPLLCDKCRSKRWGDSASKAMARPETKRKHRESLRRVFRTVEMRERCSGLAKEQMRREDRKNKWSDEKRSAMTAPLRKKLRESGWFSKWQEIGRRSVKRVSKPQLSLYKFMCFNFGDDVELEYRVLLTNNRVCYLDVALPAYKIAIEYDGAHWHQDKEKDRIRDLELEKEGWVVIRTRDGISFQEPLRQVRQLIANHNGEILFNEVRVSSIVKKQFRRMGTVYNLTVDEDNSFVAKGIVVHNCRGHFEPIVSFTDWDSFLPPPEVAFETVESIEVGDTAVRGVPVPMADQIESALGVNDIQTNVDIVPDVVDTPVWIEQERERIRQEEVDRGRRPPSDMQLDLMVNESRENQRGQIALFESPEGELSISGFSFFADEPDWFVLRARGKQAHDALTKEQHTAVDELYRIKVKESTYTIDDDGIEIIGQPVGGRIVGFITPIASQDAYNYFIESFAFYQSDPYKLEFLDPVMYEFLRDFVHAGSEFKL